MQEFAWQGFELSLPDDWECVRFSKSRQRGECAFADRSGVRLVFSWSAVKQGGDLDKLLRALIKQVRKADPEGHVDPIEWDGPEPWRGFLWDGSHRLTVAVAHFQKARYMVSAQFTRQDKKPPSRGGAARKRAKAEALEQQILDGLRWQEPDALWRWRAFGCRLNLGREFSLKECEVLPGKVALAFKSERTKRRAFRLQRLAMPQQCLAGRSLQDWYRAGLPEDSQLQQASEARVHGHAASACEVRRRRSLWDRLRRRQRAAQSYVWVCEKEQRLYCAEWDGAPEPIEKVVECA